MNFFLLAATMIIGQLPPVHSPILSPVVHPPKTIFYCAPVNGSPQGNGSKLNPWRTLKEVVDAKLISGSDPTKGVVHAGDAIYLMTGVHGAVVLKGGMNTDFITIQAAPSQVPVVNSLSITNGRNWKINGVTIQFVTGPVPQFSSLVRCDNTSNLVLTNNVIQSQPDSSQWKPDEWTSFAGYGVRISGEGIVVANNKIQNVTAGIVIGATNVLSRNILVEGNEIGCYCNDGIHVTSSDTIVRANNIHDHYGMVQNGNHNDGIQLYSLDDLTKENIIISDNRVIESTGTFPHIPTMPDGVGSNSLQGICLFDGRFKTLSITNNSVVVSLSQGISLYGTEDSLIMNNTLMRSSPNQKAKTWIGVFNAKDGRPSVNVTVRNNVAYQFSLAADTTQDHNISINAHKTLPSGYDPTKLFVEYSPATGGFNFTPYSANPLIGSGGSGGVLTNSVNIGSNK